MSKMTKRTPHRDDVAKLSREDFQDLCALLFVAEHNVQRVEDLGGKGNGLDGWKKIQDGIEGYQFRRFDDRFGPSQVRKLKDNLALAVQRAPTELGGKLRAYNVVANIDLEPGHAGQPGELDRFTSLKDWAKANYDIELKWVGVNEVHLMLLKHSYVRPDMFENIPQSIAEASSRTEANFDDIRSHLRILTDLVDHSKSMPDVEKLVLKLLSEAKTHLGRGIEHESQEEVLLAIRSLKDADRLLDGVPTGDSLRGQVLVVLSGVELLGGFLSDALKHARAAERLVAQAGDQHLLNFARGNLAFALHQNQQPEQARPIFEELLRQYERAGNMPDTARTLTHLIEVQLAMKNMSAAATYSTRLEHVAKDLMASDFASHLELGLSALGTVANFLIGVARQSQGELSEQTLRHALKMYAWIEETAQTVGFRRMELKAVAGQGMCEWNMDNLMRAEELFHRAIRLSGTDFPKDAADATFNLAFIARERLDMPRARKLFKSAHERYSAIRDISSVADCDRELARTPNSRFA